MTEIRLVELRTSVKDIDTDVQRLAQVIVPDDLAERGQVVLHHRDTLEQRRVRPWPPPGPNEIEPRKLPRHRATPSPSRRGWPRCAERARSRGRSRC